MGYMQDDEIETKRSHKTRARRIRTDPRAFEVPTPGELSPPLPDPSPFHLAGTQPQKRHRFGVNKRYAK